MTEKFKTYTVEFYGECRGYVEVEAIDGKMARIIAQEKWDRDSIQKDYFHFEEHEEKGE